MNISITLSAQRALRGAVSGSVRADSVDAVEHKIYFRCIFDRSVTEDDKELLSCAATESISDFPDLWKIDEEYLVIPSPDRMKPLEFLVFLRHETDNQRRPKSVRILLPNSFWVKFNSIKTLKRA